MNPLLMELDLRQEVGAQYWVLTFLAALSIWAGLRVALRFWIAKRKGQAVGLALGGLVLGVVFWFFAQTSRQPQVIEDPGLPDIELPDLELPDELPEEPSEEGMEVEEVAPEEVTPKSASAAGVEIQ